MIHRLATIDRDLFQQLQNQPGPRLRTIARRMAEVAHRRVGFADPRIEEALAVLRTGGAGESETRQRLWELVRELDQIAGKIRNRPVYDMASDEEYSEAFARARAASAVWFALDPEPVVAAIESAYEAHAATNDLDLIRREASSALAN